MNMTASEAEMALQMLTYNGEKKSWNWEKYVARHVKYHIMLENVMEYGYQSLNPGSKVQYMLNGIRCDKLSTAITTVWAHPDKYEKDFAVVVTFITQDMDKRAPTPSVKVASVTQTRPSKQQENSASHSTFKGRTELKIYSREEYDSMLVA